ncbi:helix-turn-helix domain-containing protein [Frankia sp. R82]|uniref:helix-turn-helix domain-containing protein n=1 Tax=Frankia sp. R82 TaxID=2950553 RepID=UPI00204398B8|nr:helix-turn-helix transcriptional regulator [Frankia sp. R82]MCM3886115.1 helix-turn-helix domain-containing protein [Frankia sp. R82]
MTTSLDQEHPLRRWRREHNASLDDVSGLTGLSAGTLSRVERGRCSLRATTKLTVSRRLGLPVRDLFPLDSVDEVPA